MQSEKQEVSSGSSISTSTVQVTPKASTPRNKRKRLIEKLNDDLSKHYLPKEKKDKQICNYLLN